MTYPESSVVEDAFTVAISADLKRRLDLYIKECRYEISGLGEVESRNGILVVTALHLLEQEVSEAETILSASSVAAFLAGAAGRDIPLKKVRLWWHSHATFGVYWSPTDEKTIESSFDTPPWWLSIVGNHQGDYLARLDIFPTPELPLRLTVQGRLVVIHSKEEVDAVREEISALVREAPMPDIKTLSSDSRSLARSQVKPPKSPRKGVHATQAIAVSSGE